MQARDNYEGLFDEVEMSQQLDRLRHETSQGKKTTIPT